MAANWDEEDPAAPNGGDDAPDWTTWLRSRLERVSDSERKAAGSVHDVPGEAAGGDAPHREGPVPPGDAAPKTAPPAPAPAPAPVSVRPAPPPAPVRPAAAAASTSGSEVDALRAAVTALVAGVGALADTVSGFRATVTERLDEYRETLLRTTTDTAAEMEAHRQVHAAATDEPDPDPALAEVNDQLQRLVAGMDDLATIRGDDERWAEVMGRLLDEVDAERQASEQERSGTGGVIEWLEGLEQAMQGIATDVAENVAGQQRVVGAVAELARAQQGVTAEMAQLAEGQQRIAEDVAELAQAQQRQADEVTQMALAQRASAEAEAVLEGAVRDAAIEQRPLPPVRPPASSGRRRAPLRAERQAPPPGRSR